MEFKETIKRIGDRLKKKVQLEKWSFTPKQIVQQNDTVGRVYGTLSLGTFKLDKELKLVQQHFPTDIEYDIEINRILNKYDEFTTSVKEFEKEAKYNTTQPLSDEGSWKATLIKVENISPVESKLTLLFSRVNPQDELETFEKELLINAENFQLSFYLSQIELMLSILETTIIPVDYYRSAINSINYG